MRGKGRERRRRGASRIALALVLALVAACGDRPGKAPEVASTPVEPAIPATPARPGVFVIGNDLGNLRPCGCSKPVLGGIERRLAFFAAIPEATRQASIVVSGGDLVVEGGRQQELKLEAFLETFDRLGVAAHCLGDGDLLVGARFWEDRLAIRTDAQTPIVCANLLVQGKALFRPYGKAVRGSRTLFVTGVISPTAHRLNEPGIEVLASVDHEALRAELRATEAADLLFFAAAPLDEARRLFAESGLGALARRSLIVVPGIADIPWMQEGGDPPLLEMGHKGQYVAQVAWPDSMQGLERWILAESLSADPFAAEVLQLYRDTVAFEDLLGAAPQFEAAEGAYAGAAACATCHPSAHSVWTNSGHARAWKSLERTGDTADPECVRCHVVDFGRTGGFDPASRSPVDVQCEACHGPGADHVATQSKTPRGLLGERVCLHCHDPANSPAFEFDEYWPKIRHRNEPR